MQWSRTEEEIKRRTCVRRMEKKGKSLLSVESSQKYEFFFEKGTRERPCSTKGGDKGGVSFRLFRKR